MVISTVASPTSSPLGSPTKFGTLRTKLWSHKWLCLAAILAIGIGGWEGVRLLMGPVVPVDQVKRGQLIETVVATGNVETLFRVNISSQITGTVAGVQVDEGQRVTAGQTLISIESSELRANVVQAQGAVAEAEAHVRQLAELTLPTAHQSLKDARASLLNVQQTFDRTSQLIHTGYATRAALDAAQKDLNVAQTQARAAELVVYSSSRGGSDFVTAQSLLDQSRANLTTASSRLAYATISAPRAGVLITRAVEQGNVVQPGSTLLVLAPDGQTQLQLSIDERNLGKLVLGQKAIASADAYPDQKFSAAVSYINPSIDITRASVEVRLSVSDPPSYLRQDMTVSVDIDVGQRDNALVLPGSSVHDALSASPWVLLVKGGRAVKQPVRVGLQGNIQTEILQGVSEGDLVIPAASSVVPGQRVRALSP
jgi:HlyD family secretion protein